MKSGNEKRKTTERRHNLVKRIFLETTKRIFLRAFKSGRCSDARRRRNGRSGSELSQVRTVIYGLDVRFATRDLFARAKCRVISKMGNKNNCVF